MKCILESGEFTEFVQHGCGQELFKVTRVTVTSTRAILPSLPSPTLWKTFVCVVFRVTVTVTGDGRCDANLCTVRRFAPSLFAPTSYPSCFPKTPYRATWRKCEHKYRGVSQSSPNNRTNQFKPRRYAVCAVRFLFVLVRQCSFCVRFKNLFKSLQKRWILCLFVLFGEKKRYPWLEKQSKNVVGGVFKCGQILYTRRFTSHNIYRSIRKGAFFHFSSVRRTRSLWSTHR